MPNTPELPYPYRIFLSYAHTDRKLVEQLANILEEMGFQPLWDRDINPGRPFTDEIRELISRSHLFFPLLTPNSSTRPWVHQEIGFAMALNVPVLPICVGHTPSEMIAAIQSVNVKADLADFAEQLQRINLEQLVIPLPKKPFGNVLIAETPEDRPQYTAQYANWVTELGVYGLVRSQARFTLFSIPDRDVNDPLWEERYGEETRSIYMRNLQRQERQTVERHARQAGCRLIIDPTAPTAHGEKGRKVRLAVLLEFLKSMPEERLEVVISPRAQDANLVIVGDYFYTEAVAWVSAGYRHSIFHSHPPTVLQRIQRFERLFAEIKAQNEMNTTKAIATIEAIHSKL